MTLPVVLAIAGCIALLIGLFGGGVKAKEIEVPRISVLQRVFSSVIGLALIGIAIWVSFYTPPSSPPPTPKPSDTPTLIASTSSISTNPIASPVPSSQPISPTSTEDANWAITFEYHFPTGYWSNGNHTYTLEASCPFAQDAQYRYGVWTKPLQVSPSASLIQGDVYLRIGGISDKAVGGNSINSIISPQSTTATFSYIEITNTEADWFVKNCSITVKPDNGSTYPLVAGSPYQP